MKSTSCVARARNIATPSKLATRSHCRPQLLHVAQPRLHLRDPLVDRLPKPRLGLYDVGLVVGSELDDHLETTEPQQLLDPVERRADAPRLPPRDAGLTRPGQIRERTLGQAGTQPGLAHELSADHHQMISDLVCKVPAVA